MIKTMAFDCGYGVVIKDPMLPNLVLHYNQGVFMKNMLGADRFETEEQAQVVIDAITQAKAQDEEHWSDCATHNEPAYPNGPCDCGVSNKAPLENEIRAKCNELAEFLIKKNKSYGNSASEPAAIFAKRVDKLAQIDVRIDDKLSRLKKGSEYPGDDTIKDLTGYLILRMIVADADEVRA